MYVPEIDKEKIVTPHSDLQDKIAEIGKLQFYYTEFEYPIELPGERMYRCDVEKRNKWINDFCF